MSKKNSIKALVILFYQQRCSSIDLEKIQEKGLILQTLYSEEGSRAQ
jgi:hypothetical protein